MAYSTGIGKAKVHNEKEVSIDFVLGEAKKMWTYCREELSARKLVIGDKDGSNQLMSDMRARHKEFCISYPIVVRYMCEMQSWHPDAFHKYLKKISIKPWKSEKEYLESQVDYIVLLYKATNKKWNMAAVEKLRANMRAALEAEHAAVKQYQDKFTAEVETEIIALQKQSKDELAEFFRKMQ